MDEAPQAPDGTAASWCAGLGAGLRALRLNRHFPPWRRVVAHLDAMASSGPVAWHPRSGLPSPRAWARIRAERALAGEQLEAWQVEATDSDELVAQVATRRARLELLASVPALPDREVQVQLRHREGDRASYKVTVDRFDGASATLSRYSLILWDTPGARLSEGELALVAETRFRLALEQLGTQDAALAFAVLQEHVLEVEEVVRGMIGPCGVRRADGRWLGPQALEPVGLHGPVVSACLERVGLDVQGGRVDDPLVASVVVPQEGVGFGLARRRKWAAPRAEVETLEGWLHRSGSRNLVYAYDQP